MAKGPINKAEAELDSAVDVQGMAPLEYQLSFSGIRPLALEEHAVADESGVTPAKTAILQIFLASFIEVSDDVLAGMVGSDDLQELHDIGGREEVQSDHRSGRLVPRRFRRCQRPGVGA